MDRNKYIYKSKKMCEEPCASCGKCFDTKICMNCDHSWNKDKCRYDKNKLSEARSKRLKEIERNFIIAYILVAIFILANIGSGIHFVIYSITNKNLGVGSMILWYISRYWWLLILDFIISFKSYNRRY